MQGIDLAPGGRAVGSWTAGPSSYSFMHTYCTCTPRSCLTVVPRAVDQQIVTCLAAIRSALKNIPVALPSFGTITGNFVLKMQIADRLQITRALVVAVLCDESSSANMADLQELSAIVNSEAHGSWPCVMRHCVIVAGVLELLGLPTECCWLLLC